MISGRRTSAVHRLMVSGIFRRHDEIVSSVPGRRLLRTDAPTRREHTSAPGRADNSRYEPPRTIIEDAFRDAHSIKLMM